MSTSRPPGRHELGQNFLTDRSVIVRVAELVDSQAGPIVEWGTGNGAITTQLVKLGRPIEGVEIDGRRAETLSRRLGPHVCINEGDILRHAPPAGAIVISSIPFHITTRVLRHLLSCPAWTYAVLIAQWEVARKRAGVGGATLLTAQWWPWFEFDLVRRVPATSFKPRPSVDGGLFTIRRRSDPLVPVKDQGAYQAWSARVFGSRGRGLAEILRRNGVPAHTAAALARDVPSRKAPLPRDMNARHWAAAFLATSRPSGRPCGPPARGRTGHPPGRAATPGAARPRQEGGRGA